jgi:hypothetical protein
MILFSPVDKVQRQGGTTEIVPPELDQTPPVERERDSPCDIPEFT